MRRVPASFHQGVIPILNSCRAAAVVVALAAVALVALATNLARAEPGASSPGYGPDNITFTTWCGEIQRYDATRCQRRDPADLAAFQTSRDRMQAFESQKQKEIRKDREFRERFESHGYSEPWQKPEAFPGYGYGYSSN